MKTVISVLLIMISLLEVNAQVVDSLNQQVSPNGGVNQLAIKYYGIDFTKEQRKIIENIEIEFIYSIDKLGHPTLSEVNGVSNSEIIDSLKSKTLEIGQFNPQITNGVPEASIYFMKLTFPTYKFTQQTFGLLQGSAYNEAKLDDFEYIKESGQRFDMTIGGMVNQFIGNPSKHLSLGGGMKIDMGYAGSNNLIYGLNMSFYANKLKAKYPINSSREQFNAPPTLLVGLIFGKWFDKFNVQGELNIGIQNITEKIGENDPDWIQLKGWSPGLVLNYPIKLGKSNPIYYYGAPTLLENNLNIHVGLRYLKLSLKEATGMMLEFGLSYRMALKGVKEYKLNKEFLNK
ncbi:MAG: hypothetical protein ACJATI_005629 [Halioglobus sp.]|jgi:hypothetical protein